MPTACLALLATPHKCVVHAPRPPLQELGLLPPDDSPFIGGRVAPNPNILQVCSLMSFFSICMPAALQSPSLRGSPHTRMCAANCSGPCERLRCCQRLSSN